MNMQSPYHQSSHKIVKQSQTDTERVKCAVFSLHSNLLLINSALFYRDRSIVTLAPLLPLKGYISGHEKLHAPHPHTYHHCGTYISPRLNPLFDSFTLKMGTTMYAFQHYVAKLQQPVTVMVITLSRLIQGETHLSTFVLSLGS